MYLGFSFTVIQNNITGAADADADLLQRLVRMRAAWLIRRAVRPPTSSGTMMAKT